MKNFLISTQLILLLFLCNTSTLTAQKKGKLTATEKENLKTANVKLFYFEAPPIFIMTPQNAAGEGLIAELTKSDDAKSLEKHRFYPNKLVQKNLDSLLKAEEVMNNVVSIKEPFEFQNRSQLKDLSKYNDVEADYIMELIVPAGLWTASYLPTKWKKYWLSLGMEVRIIRKSDLTIIWKSNLGYGGLKDERLKFHIDDLKENGKEKISAMSEIVAFECSKLILKKYNKTKK
ncbi:hypothetical protein [Aquimarina pacifica]|uniref:hypothetical protein n=1 Tax=Aquimarina pacifica TaxID=1296415 RepID=UPI000472F263|nr:hypothetical protein [Aquimarina pacifica]